jgi:hypothetical protein
MPFQVNSHSLWRGYRVDYAKVTRLVLNAFSFEDAAKQRSANISASIDAERMSKNVCHTSSGLKMTGVGALDPLQNKRAFL